MHTEPIRLPGWAATLLVVVVIPVVVAWLTDISVKGALAVALSSLAPLLIANEVARRQVDSPATVDAKLVAAATRSKAKPG